MSRPYSVRPEIFPTNPPKLVGYVVLGERNRFVSAHLTEEEANAERDRLNDMAHSYEALFKAALKERCNPPCPEHLCREWSHLGWCSYK